MPRQCTSHIALMLALIALASADKKQPAFLSPQSRSFFDVVPVLCVPPVQKLILTDVKTQHCPCFVSFGLSSMTPSKVTVDFLVMTNVEYERWKGGDFKGEPEMKVELSAMGNRAADYSFTQDFYFFQTDNMELDVEDEFALVIRTSSDLEDCDVEILHIFESKPAPCPIRLPSVGAEVESRLVKKVGGMEAVNGGENNVVAGMQVTDVNIVNYMVAITSATGSCSGTVVAKRWILTAAHCRVVRRGKVYVGGQSNLDGSLYEVKRFVPHPDYRASTDGTLELHDIALLEVESDILEGVPVMLNVDKEGPANGEYVRASGYGQIAEQWTSSNEERKLLQVDLPTVSFEDCIEAFVEWGASDFVKSLSGKAHICAGFLEEDCGGDTCYGDSGGPIVMREAGGVRYVQVGVVSGGIGCARVGLPGVYTRVAQYFKWINETTGGVEGGRVGGRDETLGVEVTDIVKRNESKRPIAGLIVAGVAGGLAVIFAMMIGIVWLLRRRKAGEKASQGVDEREEGTTIRPAEETFQGPSYEAAR